MGVVVLFFFLWSGNDTISRKSLVAWERSCEPKTTGGLNLICLETWSQAIMAKLLRNLCAKKDKLWVKWMHTYYFKTREVTELCMPNDCSWIFRAILKSRSVYEYGSLATVPEYWQISD